METGLLNQYDRQVEVTFKGENYLVRDNGAVLRKQRSGQRRRPLDEKWTFGSQDHSSGYMNVASHVVHRIVAFAFLGNPPSDEHVVEHVDTNRCNNRPENLRWVTRLENVLLNPITLKRIIIVYGSLENFFENPQAAPRMEPNIDWMRSVSKEEAMKCRERLLEWAESDTLPKGGELGEWVFEVRMPTPPIPEPIIEKQSLTPIALQRNWNTLTEFPICPVEIGANPLTEYAEKARPGIVFSRNTYNESFIIMSELGEGLLSVLTQFREESVKPWAVAQVTVENNKFVHESSGSFFDIIGAKKKYFEQLCIPYYGESVDDYC